jgi:hypothetical protein
MKDVIELRAKWHHDGYQVGFDGEVRNLKHIRTEDYLPFTGFGGDEFVVSWITLGQVIVVICGETGVRIVSDCHHLPKRARAAALATMDTGYLTSRENPWRQIPWLPDNQIGASIHEKILP